MTNDQEDNENGQGVNQGSNDQGQSKPVEKVEIPTGDVNNGASSSNQPPPVDSNQPKSKRTPEQRRKIAYDRLKRSYSKLHDKDEMKKLSRIEVQISIEGFKREWDNFLEAHEELNELITTKEAAIAQQEFFNKVALYYRECRVIMEEHLKLYENLDASTALEDVPLASTMATTNNESDDEVLLGDPKINSPLLSRKGDEEKFEATIDLKMEPIKLPVFDGAKENWILFREQFLSFVHEKKNIQKAVKMHMLFSHLSDKALRVIKGITPVASNYDRAWNVLNNRYNNNQMLINHHLKRFFGLSATNYDDPTSLIKLVDGTNELINSLPGLNEPMKTWDTILIFCLLNKIDKHTQDDWNRYLQGANQPTLNELLEFLDQRAQTNETANSSLLNKPTFKKPEFKKGTKRSVFHLTTPESTARKCKVCSENHPLFRCMKFRSLPVKERIQRARDAKVCLKCLSNHDPNFKCKFEICPVCSQGHNRLLCYEDEKRRQAESAGNSIERRIQEANVNHLILKDDIASLLGTAEVRVLNTTSEVKEMRCLCDSGSQLNLISEEAVRRFGLRPERAKIQLNGVGGKASERSDGIVTVKIGPNFGGRDAIETVFFVVKRISTHLPLERIHTDWLEQKFVNKLADPNFDKPDKVDALLGVNIWAAILKPDIKHFTENVIGQNTRFGWVIFGSVTPRYGLRYKRRSFMSALLTQKPVDNVLNFLTKFWEVEEPPKKKFRTKEQIECENHFKLTHYRTPNGRYGVRLPFDSRIDQLGQTKEAVKRQFLALERRLQINPDLREQYIEFMREYISNGHMTLADDSVDDGYYTPHHCVQSSNKFRTVFNASHLSDTGLSLNDVQLTGEKLQSDLAVLLLLFRRHYIALTADVEKMYRQIEVHPDDRKYQKVFWRESPDEQLLTYELNTITYGQAAAPFCAVRALQQCALDYQEEYPLGAKQALESFYMDDYLGGADNSAEAKEIKFQLETLLKHGGFKLSKWCSNTTGILNVDKSKLVNGIPYEDQESISVLGLRWMPKEDVFAFKHKPIKQQPVWTKRQIMSAVGKLYDPNGFVAPFIVTAKLIVQHIWQEGGNWDYPVSSKLTSMWNQFVQELPLINQLKIPRWFGTFSTAQSELHGFCDASENAYCAAIYIRTPNGIGNGFNFITHLVQAKTRVAPVSKKLTIPRMELNAAVLCVELMRGIKEALGEQILNVYYWSDSQVVLHWINKHPGELKIYAANRVNEIQEGSKPSQWNYIPTKQNPADLATRNYSYFLENQKLWFNGPTFLSNQKQNWPIWSATFERNKEVLAEEKDISATTAIVTSSTDTPALNDLFPNNSESMFKEADLTCREAFVHVLTVNPPLTRTVRRNGQQSITTIMETYSDVEKIISVVGWVKRAAKRLRNKSSDHEGTLSVEERREALTTVVRWEQSGHMRNVLQSIVNNNVNMRDRAYRELTLFMDDDGIIRLNGRIRNEQLPYDYRNPMVLPFNGILTRRVMEKAHRTTLHGGAQQMLQCIRQQFWIPKARQLAKEVVHACIVCKRFSAKKSEQRMAPLPLSRTTPGKAFLRTGVDYCGPVWLKAKTARSYVFVKAYICVFVCLATRAVHLELVSDLTTDAFIAALRRFTARRGRVCEIVSDHGSNFVGAVSEIGRIQRHLNELGNHSFAPEFGIEWKFTTERASHHGGIFEAAVKSAKKHLIRVIGEQKLTFEEYATILAQVETCLNSRPLTKLSDDPNDLTSLTPSHFLVGEANALFPGDRLIDIKSNRLGRWELLQQIMQMFWKRWNEEYLHSLINRPKWNRVYENFKVNDLVLIKEDNMSPSRWKMGRIVNAYYGSDDLVRTVLVRTATGTYRRPIVKLALLEAYFDPEPINSRSSPIELDNIDEFEIDGIDEVD